MYTLTSKVEKRIMGENSKSIGLPVEADESIPHIYMTEQTQKRVITHLSVILLNPTHAMLDHYLRDIQRNSLPGERTEAQRRLHEEPWAVETCDQWEKYLQNLLVDDDLNHKTYGILLYMQMNAQYAANMLIRESDYIRQLFPLMVARHVDCNVYGLQLNGKVYTEVPETGQPCSLRNTGFTVCQIRTFYAIQ